jgi:hypothetical protein
MKTIALVDYTLAGHHLSFMRSFCRILIGQGNHVICVVPEVEKISSWVKTELPEKTEFFEGYEYENPTGLATKFGRFNNTVTALRRWRHEAVLLKKIEKNSSRKIDLVFYAWLDNQLAQYIPGKLLDLIFPWKWTGLYFHPYHLRRETKFLDRKASWRDFDSIFLAGNCIGVTVHDLGIVEKFSRRVGKPVIHFPETADATAPDENFTVAKTIRENAKGRIVVGMIGCEKHKGTLTLARLVRDVDPGLYYFAFLGILPQSTYTEKEWEEIQAFIAERRENCFFRFEPIPEGSAYNAVFCSFDIPFLVYDDFVSSSNRLTKAAIFHRLVLSSNNYCVGEDVKNYALGAAVQPMDVQAAKAGLESLRQQVREEKFPIKNWEEYRQLNSDEKLVERFGEVTALLTSK